MPCGSCRPACGEGTAAGLESQTGPPHTHTHTHLIAIPAGAVLLISEGERSYSDGTPGEPRAAAPAGLGNAAA